MDGELDETLSEEEAERFDGGLSKSRRNKLIKAGLYPKPVRSVPNGRKRSFFKSEMLAYQTRLRVEREAPYTGIKRDAKGKMVSKKKAA